MLPTPIDLGQTDESVADKWEPYRKAGRPWLTCVEAGASLTDA